MKTVSAKLSKWLSLLLAAMMAFGALTVTACSDDGNTTEQAQGNPDGGLEDNSISAPTNVQVTLNATNQMKITCEGNATNYWFFYDKTNNSSTAEYIDWQISKSQTLMLTESGTYYFWVKAAEDHSSTTEARSKIKTSAFSEVAIYDFTYSALEAPTNVTVTAAKTNQVKITCEGNAAKYWFYYSKTNDIATAEHIDWQISKSQTLMLTESGTYYFRVKAADGYGFTEETRADIAQSAFSEVATYSFTHTDLIAPTGVTVEATTDGKVKVSWTSNNSVYYWVYHNTSNDSSSAEYVDWEISAYHMMPLTGSGTHYFWVKFRRRLRLDGHKTRGNPHKCLQHRRDLHGELARILAHGTSSPSLAREGCFFCSNQYLPKFHSKYSGRLTVWVSSHSFFAMFLSESL